MAELKLKLSYKRLSMIIPCLAIMFCYYNLVIGTYLGVAVKFVICAISLIIIMIRTFRGKLDVISIDILALLIIFIMFSWNNWDIANGSYVTTIYYTIMFVFFILASKNSDWIDIAFKFTIFVGVFYAFWTFVAWISPSIYYGFMLPIISRGNLYGVVSLYERGYIAGFTNHYSTNGLFLSSGICFTLGYYFFNGNKLKGIPTQGWFILILQVMALLLTGKRGPVLFILFAFFMTYIVYNADKPVLRYLRFAGIALAILVVFLIASLFVPQLANFIVRFQEMTASGDITTGRITLWEQAFEQFLKSPIIGSGWFWYTYHYTVDGIACHAHNCYLQWLCEVGIIGSIPFFAFMISMYRKALVLLRLVQKGIVIINANERKYLAVSSLYQTFFICSSFAGTAYYEMVSLCPYIICCAYTQYMWRKYMKKLQ